MTIELQTNITLQPLVLGGRCVTKRVTVVQDGARSGDIVMGTLMAYNPTTAKWEPWDNVAATDGTAQPSGVLYEDITEAAIKAADVTATIILADALINEDLVTMENSYTKATIVNVPTNLNKSAEQCLRLLGIILVDCIDATSYEA